MLFDKKDNINGYTVMFPHKQGSYAETYRVKSPAGKTYFLKLINKTKLSSVQLNDEGKIIEIEVVRNLAHPNICSYIDEGKLIHNGQPYEYFKTFPESKFLYLLGPNWTVWVRVRTNSVEKVGMGEGKTEKGRLVMGEGWKTAEDKLHLFRSLILFNKYQESTLLIEVLC